MQRFRVHVGGDQLGFAAAHFITYEDGECESLHGHNYAVRVSVEGPLNDAAYVLDFVALRRHAAGVLDELDHRLLLPDRNPRLRVEREGESVRARCGEREYRFPASDARILPVANTTAEALAAWLVERLRDAVSEAEPDVVEVTVRESPGQSATCAWTAP